MTLIEAIEARLLETGLDIAATPTPDLEDEVTEAMIVRWGFSEKTACDRRNAIARRLHRRACAKENT